MTKDSKELLKEYSVILIKMGVAHAIGIGLDTLASYEWEDIERDVKERHKNDGKEETEDGHIVIHLITEDFEMDLQRLAYDLSKMEHEKAMNIIKDFI